MSEYRALPEEGAKSVINQEFEDQLVPVRNEVVQNMTDETVRLLSEQTNKKLVQQKIAINLSRLSPVCCFTYLVSDIAGTGVLGLETFTRQAEQFQQRVEREVYDKYMYVQYGMGGTSMGMYNLREGMTRGAQVPHMSDYRHTTVTGALRARWLDLFLIAFYTLLFFVAGFVRFLRYDVR